MLLRVKVVVQAFWRYYCNLARPSQLQPGDNYHLFRTPLKPAQEALPAGGCWFLRLRGAGSAAFASEINRLWETLLLALIGETLSDGEASASSDEIVVGGGLSVRARDTVLTIWCRGDDR